ncbi:septal ring lytic transglycosylase RlpA family protein [Goodfellowiella coeruleoviolacea]|uniref:Rare lipoprotein A n=1 Tax=Goodfellowiella coeruleoviolacea TaxID=334858 RepID=A0AAE3KIT1_9PSEU|nr:septal ring lytic transglycosylase RlpA family protein [Goodfellowiella coeruleoviolacea]MCP2163598.1 rare lipoprotein A [Goodfellowiella coeruleoviolacea]
MRHTIRVAALAASGVLSLSSAGVATAAAEPAHVQMSITATCNATWYGADGEIPPGSHTASGEIFDRYAMTAAHRSLPFNTLVDVSYQGRTITVRINDRGAFADPVCLDLTYGAFGQLANRDLGVITVGYTVR